jgi:hypothetical protein
MFNIFVAITFLFCYLCLSLIVITAAFLRMMHFIALRFVNSPSQLTSLLSTLDSVEYKINHQNYLNNENVNWFYQPVSGMVIYNVHFYSSDLEAKHDYLSIGPYGVANSPSTSICTGTCSDVVSLRSSTGVSYQFTSDAATTRQGFQLITTYVVGMHTHLIMNANLHHLIYIN